ncbi:MAG: hypothetical protein WA982_14165 [Rubrobacteraceae bacterium]
MKQRLLKEEDGFTLPEALVAMLMMVTVMFALYAIFDMSLRVFSFGNDKTEAVESARIGLSKMEREIRAAYPHDKPNDDNTRLSIRDPDQISFGNDIDPIDRRIDAGEEISYYSNDKKLLRRKGSLSRTVVAPVPKEGLKFEYFEADGVTVAENESDTEIVSITLKIEVDGRAQTLSTDVALRNEGGI